MRQGRWNNQGMAIQRAPQQLPDDPLRKRGPGTLRTPADTTGPSIQTPLIHPEAQTQRSSQILRAPVDGTNARQVDRGASYPGQASNYGTT